MPRVQPVGRVGRQFQLVGNLGVLQGETDQQDEQHTDLFQARIDAAGPLIVEARGRADFVLIDVPS